MARNPNIRRPYDEHELAQHNLAQKRFDRYRRHRRTPRFYQGCSPQNGRNRAQRQRLNQAFLAMNKPIVSNPLNILF